MVSPKTRKGSVKGGVSGDTIEHSRIRSIQSGKFVHKIVEFDVGTETALKSTSSAQSALINYNALTDDTQRILDTTFRFYELNRDNAIRPTALTYYESTAPMRAAEKVEGIVLHQNGGKSFFGSLAPTAWKRGFSNKVDNTGTFFRNVGTDISNKTRKAAANIRTAVQPTSATVYSKVGYILGEGGKLSIRVLQDSVHYFEYHRVSNFTTSTINFAPALTAVPQEKREYESTYKVSDSDCQTVLDCLTNEKVKKEIVKLIDERMNFMSTSSVDPEGEDEQTPVPLYDRLKRPVSAPPPGTQLSNEGNGLRRTISNFGGKKTVKKPTAAKKSTAANKSTAAKKPTATKTKPTASKKK